MLSVERQRGRCLLSCQYYKCQLQPKHCCKLKLNSAASGGVLYTNGHYNHHMEFIGCAFDFNEATDNVTGGGVAFIGNSTLAIISSNFKDNSAAGHR